MQRGKNRKTTALLGKAVSRSDPQQLLFVRVESESCLLTTSGLHQQCNVPAGFSATAAMAAVYTMNSSGPSTDP